MHAVKNKFKFILQKLLGYRTYLLVFALFKIRTLRWDKKEKDFFVFLNEIDPTKGMILDVGANLGIMTDHLSRKFQSTPILAIEPMPDNIEILKSLKKSRKWTRVELIEKAVGESAGSVTMILPNQGKTKMHGLSHVKCEEITDWNEGQEVKVELTTLDQLVDNRSVAAIKMDVENYEYQALLGAKSILSQSRPIIYLELWDNENRVKTFDLLKELNYSARVVENGQLVTFESGKHFQQNFLFLPN